MCLYIPSSRKRRYPATTHEDHRPRKRRVTYQQLPAHVRYEPLRGHGVKRDPPSAPAVNANGTLRGNGTRRDPPRQEPELKVHFAIPVAETVAPRPAAVRQRTRHSSKSHSEHRRKERDSRDHSHRQYRSSLATAQENPLHMAQAPMHDYRIPASYYLDLCAVRAATNEALQATIYEPTPPAQEYRNLRRQPAYTRLRY
ncbi:hypothetical protein NA57DRAFT_74393 [Rhizodiscina lignyota]|uniref:Uncharacterized protein n=1 Tax=Rhizodiscina lignyota TaxID=1504668 RepID=A0A9P4MAX2_9PEZI|nr:hypothetical protein NA57DRAFT_74393 [Rhizodiscina lignyota]